MLGGRDSVQKQASYLPYKLEFNVQVKNPASLHEIRRYEKKT